MWCVSTKINFFEQLSLRATVEMIFSMRINLDIYLTGCSSWILAPPIAMFIQRVIKTDKIAAVLIWMTN
jgi:hypothetical protein